jgi:CRISPR-associated protein Cmr5
MASRDQERAALAYQHVSDIGKLDDGARKKYASIVHAMVPLLQTAGLCQALHFARSRSNETQRRIVEHLAGQLERVNPAIRSGDALLERARKAELAEYLQLTDEAMASAAWYRRMVQGVLGIDQSDAEGD